MMIVMSVTGWDGHRVLGVFTTEKEALKALEDSSIPYNEKVTLDFVEINKIACTMSLGSCLTSPIKRTHIYDEAHFATKNHSKDEGQS